MIRGGLDTTIKLFDALSGECLHVLEGLESGTGSLAFSPLLDGMGGSGLIAGGGWNSDLFVWDVEVSAIRCLAWKPGVESNLPSSLIFCGSETRLAAIRGR